MSDAIIKAAPPKSWIENFVERAKGEIKAAPPATPVAYVRQMGSVAGEYVEGGIVSSLLGAAHAKFGLDTRGGPIDGWIAGLGALGAVGLSGHFPMLAERALRAGRTGWDILLFRKSFETVNHGPMIGAGNGAPGVPGVTRIAAPGKGPGIAGEDPIEVVARGLG
jgi:hypothetical protein